MQGVYKQEPLYRIGKRKSGEEVLVDRVTSPVRPNERFLSIFFIVGSVSGFIGAAVLGTWLWISPASMWLGADAFQVVKNLHAQFQIFLLFGLCILGFIFLSATVILGCIQQTNPRFPYLIGILLLVGTLLGFIDSLKETSTYVRAAPFLLTLTSLYLRRTAESHQKPEWLFVTMSLIGFSFGSVTNISIPIIGLLIFLMSVVSLLIGFAPAFIANLLGGNRLKKKDAYFIFILLIMSLGTLQQVGQNGSEAAFRFAIALLIFVFLYVVLKTRLFRIQIPPRDTTIAFALRTGFSWALLGSLLAFIFGISFSDYYLHALATGFALPILTVISLRVMENMNGIRLHSDKIMLTALVVWQLVPIMRVVIPSISAPSGRWLIIEVGVVALFIGWMRLSVLAHTRSNWVNYFTSRI